MKNSEKLRRLLQQELKQRRVFKKKYSWFENARPNQLPPDGFWKTWLILAGRGFGKTRTGSETLRSWVETGQVKRIALVGGSLHEVRSVMVEGESGILNVHPPKDRPLYIPSQRLIKLRSVQTFLFSRASLIF